MIGADIIQRFVKGYDTSYSRCRHQIKEMKGKTVEGYITPSGELWEERVDTGGTEYISKHMIETSEDIKVFLELLEDMKVSPDYREYEEVDRYLGDDGIVTLWGPLTPIQEMLQFKMGVAGVTFALMDNPDLMAELFSRLHEKNREIYSIQAASPAKALITYEDTSTTVMSPAWYEEYCARELDEYADILHGGKVKFIVHMCGKISLITGLIAKGKMDALDSVCPPTTGDLEPWDALTETGKIIIGGLEPPTLERSSVDEAVNYARKQLEGSRGKGPFILSTGDATSAGTPVENLKAIAGLCRN